MLAFSAVAFGLAWWLGLYLIARDPGKPLLRRAAYGLIAYAVAIACHALAQAAGAGDGTALTSLRTLAVSASGVAWAGVLLLLHPEPAEWQHRADRWWRGSVWLTGIVLLGAVGAVFTGVGQGFGLVAPLLVVAHLVAGFGVFLRAHRRVRPGPVTGVVVAGTILFGLGLSGVALSLEWLPDWLLLAGIGLDLAILGGAVAVFDAFFEGETLRPDMQRSAVVAALAAALFGGQIGLAMLIVPGRPLLMTALLLGSVAAAVAAQVLANPLHRALDRLSFPAADSLRAERAALREVSDALPRRDPIAGVLDLDPAEFGRLTRRALSHYGDLGRLVTSPLTELPLIERRLAERSASPSPIERATELKALLLESITRLKPPEAEFGASDEWRHYNALYFPYVVGLRPYSQRARHAGLSAPARQALRWFQTEVPERTLHNWQNAAAKLVADDLWARSHAPIDQL